MLLLYLMSVGLAVMSFQVHFEEIIPWTFKWCLETLHNDDLIETTYSLSTVYTVNTEVTLGNTGTN